MRNVYIPLLIVWTVVIIFQQIAIFTLKVHSNKQRYLIDTCEVALTMCVDVTEDCVRLIRKEK